MIKKIEAYIRQHHMIEPGDHVNIGLSGGADSVCLFLALERLRVPLGFTMAAVHIDHGIRGEESKEDMRFANQLALKYHIPFTGRAYSVELLARQRGLSLEEAGRNVRYQVFEQERKRFEAEAAERGGMVRTAVAHHGNDNAETMLFRICRGTGIEGLAGIRPVRGTIIRPLLCVTRNEIEAFLAEEGQSYRTDATNADILYSRNRIRNRIMPEFEQINAQAVRHMNSLSEDAAEISEYLAWEAERILQGHMEQSEDGTICFRIEKFFSYPPVLQRRVMLGLIAAAACSRKDIAREHANALRGLICGQTGRRISLPYGITAEKTYDALLLTSAKQQAVERDFIEISLDKAGEQEQSYAVLGGTLLCRILPFTKKYEEIPKNLYTKWFDYDKIKNRLYLRYREPGDYFVLDALGHRQKLKQYLINEKVPKAERNRVLLLAEDSHILWAVGYRISEYYKVTEDTNTVLEVWYVEDSI